MFNRTRLQPRQLAAPSACHIRCWPGCGLSSSVRMQLGDDGAEPIVVGTTSAPSTLDPAAAWDGSWELFRNVYQTLLSFPTARPSPSPTPPSAAVHRHRQHGLPLQAARGPEVLQRGQARRRGRQVLHRPHPEDQGQGGPAGLLGSLDRVEAKGDRESSST